MAAAIRLAASSTAPRSHNDHDIRAKSATPASWPAARAASRSLSLLALNASNAFLITELASVSCPMNSKIMPCPRVALSRAAWSPRASARLRTAVMVSRASGNSPRITLAVVSQNNTWRYSGGSPSRSHSERARMKVSTAVAEAGPCVAIRQGPRAIRRSSSCLSFAGLSEVRAKGLKAALKMCNRLEIGGSHRRFLARSEPIMKGSLEQRRFREMVRQRLRLCFDNFRKAPLKRVCDRGVQLHAPALEQTSIGRVSEQAHA